MEPAALEQKRTSEQRRQRRARRSSLLTAAFWTFVEHGYAEATLDQIAAAAGITKPTIYSYFPSKDDLFTEAVRHIAGLVRVDIISALTIPGVYSADLGRPGAHDDHHNSPVLKQLHISVRDGLLQMTENLLRRSRSPMATALRRLAIAEALRFPQLAEESRHIVGHPSISSLQELLDELSRSGDLTITDHRIAAHHYYSLALGEALQLDLLDIHHNPDETRKHTIAAVDAFLQIYSNGSQR